MCVCGQVLPLIVFVERPAQSRCLMWAVHASAWCDVHQGWCLRSTARQHTDAFLDGPDAAHNPAVAAQRLAGSWTSPQPLGHVVLSGMPSAFRVVKI